MTSASIIYPDVEEVISKLNINGASAWNQLFGHLTSMTTIEFNGEKHTMASIRNLAYSHDPKIRKDAYYKELELYEKMDDSIAFALNSIKGTVNTVSTCEDMSPHLIKHSSIQE